MSSNGLRYATISQYPDLVQGPRRVVMLMVGSMLAFLLIGLVWMNFASLAVSVNAPGTVIPSSRIQQVQSLEGGIVQEIAVREGQQVSRGDLLVRLGDHEFSSELGEAQQNYWGFLASIARLEAEISGRALSFPEEVMRNVPNLVERERELFESRQREREAASDGARRQVDQRRQELAEVESNIRSLESNRTLTQERLSIERTLFENGAGSRSDYLSASQEFEVTEGELRSAKINVTRLNAAVNEARAKVKEIESRFVAEASQQRSELQTKVAALAEVLSGKRDRVERRDVRAQMDGVINRLLISTVGGVAKSGESMMEIVPLDDVLLVTARVNPKDIAFIHAGQTAKLRVSAFDSSIYGALGGTVKRIGADAILDEKKQPYFEVQLETEKNYIGSAEAKLKITPGMTTDVSINTGERTLMAYLLKPIFKTFDTALTER
ncbi:MAG: HlyD family type I secretion periplasmic adaptor subunit [Thiotrichales bacterium]